MIPATFKRFRHLVASHPEIAPRRALRRRVSRAPSKERKQKSDDPTVWLRSVVHAVVRITRLTTERVADSPNRAPKPNVQQVSASGRLQVCQIHSDVRRFNPPALRALFRNALSCDQDDRGCPANERSPSPRIRGELQALPFSRQASYRLMLAGRRTP